MYINDKRRNIHRNLKHDSLFIPGQGHGGKQPALVEVSEAAGAAVGCEDVHLESRVTPASLMGMVRGVLSDNLVRSVDAVYQFELSGPNGGVFYLDLKRGKIEPVFTELKVNLE